MYDLGIVGGMGPLATAEFFRRIIQYTDAYKDQEHINICLLNKTEIPDRTRYLLKDTTSPIPYINNCIQELNQLGVKVIAMPCNTSHFFVDHFEMPENICFVNMVYETILILRDHFPEKFIYVLGTTGTKLTGVYDAYAKLLPDKHQLIYPEQNMQKQIMEIIYMVKTGEADDAILFKLSRLLEENKKVNYDETMFIIACTELSLYSNELSQKYTLIDTLDILTIKCIQACGFLVRNEMIPNVLRVIV